MFQIINFLSPNATASPLHSVNDKSFVSGAYFVMNKNEVISILKEIVEKYIASTDLNHRIQLATEHTVLLMKYISLFEYDYGSVVPEDEVWKNITGYEGIYQISNHGNIKALERFFIKNRKGGKQKQAVYQPELIRTRKYSPKGYVRTSCWRDGLPKHYIVHRLVAIHFIPNPKNYSQVLHKDDNPRNPRWDNLFWGTQSDNIKDCVEKGRWHTGSKNNNAKLTESDIPKIRELISEGMSSRKIAEQFNIAKSQILSIKNNKTWKHIK